MKTKLLRKARKHNYVVYGRDTNRYFCVKDGKHYFSHHNLEVCKDIVRGHIINFAIRKTKKAFVRVY